MHSQRNLFLAVLTAGLAGPFSSVVTAQDAVLIGGRLVAQGQGDIVDEGANVEMFESPNLDRFLRRARQFLDEDKYPEAIQVLQSVIEGRTLVATAPSVPDDPEENSSQGQPVEPAEEAPSAEDGRRLADPAQNVFSQDGRIYRPARRLCHEYLALMPPVGLELVTDPQLLQIYLGLGPGHVQQMPRVVECETVASDAATEPMEAPAAYDT